MRVLIEQQIMMRRGNRIWVSTVEEEPTGKVLKRNYVVDTRNGERTPMSAKDAKMVIEAVNQERLKL